MPGPVRGSGQEKSLAPDGPRCVTGLMKVERFDPQTDGASVRACHEIYLSGLPDDDPLGPPMSPACSQAGWPWAGPRTRWKPGWPGTTRASPAAGTRSTFRSARTVTAPRWSSRCTLPGAGKTGARRCSGTRPAGRTRPAGPCWRRRPGKARPARRSRARSRPGRPGPGSAGCCPWSARPRLDGPQRGRKPSPPPAAIRCDPGSARRPTPPSPGSPPSTGRWPTRPGRPGRRSRSGTWPGSGWTSTGSRPWGCGPT